MVNSNPAHDTVVRSFGVADGYLTETVSQEIPEHFLQFLSDERVASANTRAGEYHHLCSVPVALVEKWMRQGFNVYDRNVDAREIMKRLKVEGYDYFVATSKSI